MTAHLDCFSSDNFRILPICLFFVSDMPEPATPFALAFSLEPVVNCLSQYVRSKEDLTPEPYTLKPTPGTAYPSADDRFCGDCSQPKPPKPEP